MHEFRIGQPPDYYFSLRVKGGTHAVGLYTNGAIYFAKAGGIQVINKEVNIISKLYNGACRPDLIVKYR